ncbi:MAG: hypothetical protein HXX19_13815 [Rhodoferax sp.]|nr:hypothetical protein [Rhodoferax sp.]
MLEAFGNHRPPEVCEVMANEIKFITNKGNIKLASLAAIRGRIHRMTTIQPAIDGVH